MIKPAVSFLMLVIAASMAAGAAAFQLALPGYKFAFPKDHASHDKFKTEWWYYTGHLVAKDGRRFGYELTFFRSAVEPTGMPVDSPWCLKNVYLTHFAVSDIRDKKFVFLEKTNRSGIGTAGASDVRLHVWNTNWSAEQRADAHLLKASGPDYSINLALVGRKAPLVHGKDGVSQKASCKGCASHYYSLTRLSTSGEIKIGTQTIPVEGVSWMDHEFGSNQLTAEQVGWDWYSLQLSNNTELMLYLMRRRDGTYDPNSSGTIYFADGRSEHLLPSDFKIKATDSWQSPHSKGIYPSGWEIEIPKLKLQLNVLPLMRDQELVTTDAAGVTYWEGACSVQGRSAGEQVSGDAYVELTGYAQQFRKNI